MTYFFILFAAALLVAVSFVYYHQRKIEKKPEPIKEPSKIVPSNMASILSTQQLPAERPSFAERGPLTDKKILVVDDQPSIRLMLKELFASQGVEVFEAENGDAALKLIGKHTLNCVLLDLKMPDIDGIDVLREIRKQSQAVPVVLITAYAEPSKMEEALKLGISHCFTKPFDIIELKEEVLLLME
ncbi:response regulator [Paenibacillus paridis]|uniref:response regulator n=1 Tax=Paenibacillus paridis TaxID=2583376 RepID=UPI00112037D5|nr:response regulator [Paenibacillus paridis]